mgnify:CR=1 FL=1
MYRKTIKQASVLASALLLSLSAAALDLNGAKGQGLVGELGNGYLGVVDAGNTEAATLVADINAKRKSKYGQIAKKSQTSIKDVETLMGEKLLKKAKAGQMVKEAGKWVKR